MLYRLWTALVGLIEGVCKLVVVVVVWRALLADDVTCNSDNNSLSTK